MTVLDTCAVCTTPRPADRRGREPWCCSLACYYTFHGIDRPATVGPDGPTTTCPVCQRSFRPVDGRRFCSDACRVAEYRRRDAVPGAPRGRPEGPVTVWACPRCGARAVGRRRCPACATPMRTIGLGGPCPRCGEAVAVTEILAQEVVPPTA